MLQVVFFFISTFSKQKSVRINKIKRKYFFFLTFVFLISLIFSFSHYFVLILTIFSYSH
jgi:hypothetical protein